MNRRAFVIGGTALTLVGIVAACSFPDVNFRDDKVALTNQDGSAEQDANTSDDTNDAGIVDAESRTDATQRVDGSACEPTNCDCDNDRYNRAGCDAGADADAGPIDCDDLDPLRHPNAVFTDEVPDGTQKPPGDWNCDDSTETAYEVNMACSGLLCAHNAKGFKNDPGCGEEGDLYQCVAAALGLGCDYEYVDKKKLPCR